MKTYRQIIEEDGQHKQKLKAFAKGLSKSELQDMFNEYKDAGRMSKSVKMKDWLGYMTVEAQLNGFMK